MDRKDGCKGNNCEEPQDDHRDRDLLERLEPVKMGEIMPVEYFYLCPAYYAQTEEPP